MPSLISGYEYDIFVSYRHKDNKGGHWVTGFVDALRTELEATFKEDISIYFDENPHDGLLENQDVDKSLQEKLKCVIFIPIISQTYCDPKSFAWKHEFLAFNKLASADSIGRWIRLKNGNVSSRILPIRIHDIDATDRALLEQELGGVLRSIDFIYTSPGVNRPLAAHEEHAQDNQKKTYYRDQINKVSNSIKASFSSLMNESPDVVKGPISTPLASKRSKPLRIAVSLTSLLVAIVLFFIFYNKEGQVAVDNIADRSVAVLPFADISDEADQRYYSEGMTVEIMDHLFKIEGLRVIPRNSMEAYRDSPKSIKEIASELGVVNLVTGSVRKSGNRVKISVQLIRGADEQHLWQETYEKSLTDVFSIQSDVATQVANALNSQIRPEVRLRMEAIPTNSERAYDLFLRGKQEYYSAWGTMDPRLVKRAIQYYNQAIAEDSKFSNAYAGLGQGYWWLAHYDTDYTPEYWNMSKENLMRAIALDSTNGFAYSELAVVQHNWDWDKKAALRSLRKAVHFMPGDLEIHVDFFWYYMKTLQCDSMKTELDIMNSIQPRFNFEHQVWIAICEGDLNRLAALEIPDDPQGTALWAFIEANLILNKFDEASKLIEKSKQFFGKEFYLVFLGEWQALSGRRDEALATMREMEELSKTQHIWPGYFASIYLGLGDDKNAYRYLEKARAEKDLSLHTLPYHAPGFRKMNDKRFVEFIKGTWKEEAYEDPDQQLER